MEGAVHPGWMEGWGPGRGSGVLGVVGRLSTRQTLGGKPSLLRGTAGFDIHPSWFFQVTFLKQVLGHPASRLAPGMHLGGVSQGGLPPDRPPLPSPGKARRGSEQV